MAERRMKDRVADHGELVDGAKPEGKNFLNDPF